MLNIQKQKDGGIFLEMRDEYFSVPRLELIYPVVCRKFGKYIGDVSLPAAVQID
jgi:hypothetical protein